MSTKLKQKSSLSLAVAGIGGGEQITLDYTITETGIVLGTESIKTAAGSFEGCLKVEYRTETTAVFNPPEEVDPPGEHSDYCMVCTQCRNCKISSENEIHFFRNDSRRCQVFLSLLIL